jgi:5S rRNA maturation endonuclease (ribonuclease M5)
VGERWAPEFSTQASIGKERQGIRAMTSDEIKAANPIEIHAAARGAKIVGSGPHRTTNQCPSVQHKSGHLCVTLDVPKQLWHCNDCKVGGDVIRWIALESGRSDSQVLRELGGNGAMPAARPVKVEEGEPLKFETVATYDYSSPTGGLVYQVVRQHAADKSKSSGYSKTFRQRRPDDCGGWIYNMEGVERVLYRLGEVMIAKTVVCCEGEKDADNLVKLGFCATCNVGGAGKWMDAYSDTLAKKHVAICGDNDEPGREHVKRLFDSLTSKAKSVRILKVPTEYKDVSDYIASFKDEAEAKRAVFALFDSAAPFVRGVSLPIFRVAELEEQYRRHVLSLGQSALDLSIWLPSLRKVRSLVPGELVFILGATGIGKTAILSNIALKAWPMPTLMFELELPPELMFERTIALKTRMSCLSVEQAYKSGDALGEAAIDQKLSHLHICTEARLGVSDIERLIIRSELKIGERPRLVLVDYVGLIRGTGKSRYERVSAIAEELKVVAKTTRTILIVTSQVARDDEPEITLSSGKDSGSLENSAGVVLGFWRDTEDTTLMHGRVLKATKGGAGTKLMCNYNLDTLAITERTGLSDEDIPNTRGQHND